MAGNILAGWGAVMFTCRNGVYNEFMILYGPMVLNPHPNNWLGSQGTTNNTGELPALTVALIWVSQEAPDGQGHDIELVYDSQYAAAALQGDYDCNKELLLIDTGLHVLHETRKSASVHWRWVKGHGHVLGNTTADQIAPIGEVGGMNTGHHRWNNEETHGFRLQHDEGPTYLPGWKLSVPRWNEILTTIKASRMASRQRP